MEHSVEVLGDGVKVLAQPRVVLDIVGGLKGLQHDPMHSPRATHLLRSLDNRIHALARQVLDKLLQVPTGLLHLFILVAHIALLDGLIECLLGLGSILLDDVHQGVDSLVVGLVLLGLNDDLLESVDELVFCFIGGGELFVKVLRDARS